MWESYIDPLPLNLLGPTKFHLHYGDLSDSTNLVYIIASVQPTEIYNLGAQSHVKVSFEMAEYTVGPFDSSTCHVATLISKLI
jgi:GDP-D-mannose dehydratase